MKLKADPLHPVEAKRHFWKFTTLAGWFWSAFAGLIVLAGGWTIVNPVVHLDPYNRLNPDSPFSERFRVSNDGNFDIDDVSFRCLVVNASSEYNNSQNTQTNNLFDADVAATISAHGSTTVDCPVEQFLGYDATHLHYTAAEMEFRMRFRPTLYWWQKPCFRFIGVLNSQQQVEWTYENNKCSDISKTFSERSNANDLRPTN